MKALIVAQANRLELREIAAPRVGAYDALVQIEVCGICNSTDAKLINGTMFWAPPFPLVLGHEAVGRVIEVGANVRRWKIGDRVTRPIYVCADNEKFHAAMGGFAELGVVRDAQAMADDGDASLLGDYNALRQLKVPATMSARDGALAISLSETASVLRHLPNSRGQAILVAGTGVAGLAFALWFKLAGARVLVLGRREERLQHARELGADVVVNTCEPDYLRQIEGFANDCGFADGHVDGIVEATGHAVLARELLTVLKPDGFACAYGVPPTGVSYDARWQTAEVEEHLSFDWVCDLLARGWVKPEWFASHDWDFADVMHGFEQVKRGEVTKGFVAIRAP